jgi:branched-chain amino acid transport system permease protein
MTTQDTGDNQATTTPEVSALGPESTAGRSWKERTLLRHGLLMLVALVGVVLLLESVGAFRVTQFAVMAYYLPAVAGLTVLTGINGQISLGHGALMAVGAYTTAWWLQNIEGTPFLVIVAVAVAVTTVVGGVVGVAAARLHGPYLAGATLALAIGLPGVAIYFEHQLGGEEGIRV